MMQLVEKAKCPVCNKDDLMATARIVSRDNTTYEYYHSVRTKSPCVSIIDRDEILQYEENVYMPLHKRTVKQ